MSSEDHHGRTLQDEGVLAALLILSMGVLSLLIMAISAYVGYGEMRFYRSMGVISIAGIALGMATFWHSRKRVISNAE